MASNPEHDKNGDEAVLTSTADHVDFAALLDLYSNVNVLFCVAEPSGYFSLLNPYWTTLLGWSLEELKAKPFIEFVHPDDRISTNVQADKQFEGNQSVNAFINRYRTKDGHYKWLEWSAKSPNGGTLYAVATDITDKKEKELELKQVQNRLQELVQNAPGAFFQYIVNTDGSHCVQYMSLGSADIWGLTPEEIGEDPSCLWAMIFPDDLKPLEESIAQSIENLSRWEQEYRINHPSGETKWLRGIGTPKRLPSGGTFWNSLVMDMTELREQQDTITRMQRMDMIGHLASGVSHDFNNILAIIDGHRKLIGMKTTDPALQEHTELMGTAIKRATQLTKRLLLSSKKTTVPMGQQVAVVSSLADLRALLDEITPPNIEVSWHIDNNCPAAVDSSEFEDVITNLFVNARNALTEKGNIRIRLQHIDEFSPNFNTYVHLEPKASQSYSVVSVSDNGCGIDSADFEKIFIPFISKTNKGTGLGLAMLAGFATRHHCGITLDSAKGIGTTISLWLPEQEQTLTPPSETLLETTSDARYKIVLIDDEFNVLNVVSDMLNLRGHETIKFSSADSGVQWLRENHQSVDLVLTDEVMPGDIQGHNIHREFNEKLPVLIMSGYLDVKNFNDEKVEVLHKPVSLETLEGAIRKVMQRVE